MVLILKHGSQAGNDLHLDQVVGVLLALRDARIPMDADAMQGWALANGWSGRNPERLAQYVRDISGGKRPPTRSDIRADYVDVLRARVESGDAQDDE